MARVLRRSIGRTQKKSRNSPRYGQHVRVLAFGRREPKKSLHQRAAGPRIPRRLRSNTTVRKYASFSWNPTRMARKFSGTSGESAVPATPHDGVIKLARNGFMNSALLSYWF